MLIVTPTVIDNKSGTKLLITADSMPEEKEFTNFQNTVIAASTESTTIGKNQSIINGVVATAGVEILESKTPMSVQESLTKGQDTGKPAVPVSEILGKNDRQSTGSKDSQDSRCGPGDSAGDGSADVARCKNESDGQALTQTLMNMFADNGSLSQVFKRADGNPSMLKDIFKTKKKQSQKDSSTYGSARQKIIYGMMARVTIFMGYEKDSSGDFMIKRPIFKSPTSWDQVMSSLRSKNNSNDILLCRIESDPDAPPGLQMVETNVYFLITKDENTLVSEARSLRQRQTNTPRRDIGTPRRDRLESAMREKNIPPEALRSLYMTKKGKI